MKQCSQSALVSQIFFAVHTASREKKIKISSAVYKQSVSNPAPIKCFYQDSLFERVWDPLQVTCSPSFWQHFSQFVQIQSCTFQVNNVGRDMNGKENNPYLSLLFERNVMLLATKLFSTGTKTSCCVYCILQNTEDSFIISK